jgi:hypothetical protein
LTMEATPLAFQWTTNKCDKHPINIESFEDFRDKPFDELWLLATTPKTSLN